jgi:hypothetical protein
MSYSFKINIKLYLGLGLISMALIFAVLFYPFFFIEAIVRDGKNNSAQVSINNSKLANYAEGVDFDSFNDKFYKQYTFVNTSMNPFNPVITFVAEDKNVTDSISVEVYSLRRSNVHNFDFESRYNADIKNKTFEEAVEIARRYDLSKENPDPDNITVFEPPTAEEIEARKQREIERERTGNTIEQLTAKEEELSARVDRLPPEGKTEYEAKVENNEFIDILDQAQTYQNVEDWLNENYPETRE